LIIMVSCAFDIDSGEGVFFRGYQYDGVKQCL
jgi:hypothetical protein